MTACALVVGNNGIEMFSDGSAYDEDGIFRQYCNKIEVMPHIPALVFCRGSGNASEYAKGYFSHLESFDRMVELLAVGSKFSSLKANLYDGDPLNLSVVIAGFSETRQKWEGHQIGAAAQGGQILDFSFVPQELEWFYAEPWPDETELDKAGLMVNGEFVWNCTVEDGIAFLNAQRTTAVQMHPDNELTGCTVGAFIQHTVLTKDMVNSQIVHRWPDKIGEKLNIEGCS